MTHHPYDIDSERMMPTKDRYVEEQVVAFEDYQTLDNYPHPPKFMRQKEPRTTKGWKWAAWFTVAFWCAVAAAIGSRALFTIMVMICTAAIFAVDPMGALS